MLLKSKYCLECNEKLPEYDENFLLRSNYCEVCKPAFRSKELLLRFGVIGFVAVPSIINFGLFLQKPVEKPLNVSKSEIASVVPAPKPVQKVENNQPEKIVQTKRNETNQPSVLPLKQSETQSAKQSFDKKTLQNTPEVSQSLPIESVYICGAKTKKGTPCSRRVKGSVRCWQHLGQEAVLPAKDLRIQ
jgi:hypothetical protein